MSDLFKAAGLEKDAPRPLADRLRPERLSDIVGQDHLLPDGALTRLLRAHTLGSLIFWGLRAPARPRRRGFWRMKRLMPSCRFQRSFPASRS